MPRAGQPFCKCPLGDATNSGEVRHRHPAGDVVPPPNLRFGGCHDEGAIEDGLQHLAGFGRVSGHQTSKGTDALTSFSLHSPCFEVHDRWGGTGRRQLGFQGRIPSMSFALDGEDGIDLAHVLAPASVLHIRGRAVDDVPVIVACDTDAALAMLGFCQVLLS